MNITVDSFHIFYHFFGCEFVQVIWLNHYAHQMYASFWLLDFGITSKPSELLLLVMSKAAVHNIVTLLVVHNVVHNAKLWPSSFIIPRLCPFFIHNCLKNVINSIKTAQNYIMNNITDQMAIPITWAKLVTKNKSPLGLDSRCPRHSSPWEVHFPF